MDVTIYTPELMEAAHNALKSFLEEASIMVIAIRTMDQDTPEYQDAVNSYSGEKVKAQVKTLCDILSAHYLLDLDPREHEFIAELLDSAGGFLKFS